MVNMIIETDVYVERLDYSDGDFTDICAYGFGDEAASEMPVFSDAVMAVDLDPEWVSLLDQVLSDGV